MSAGVREAAERVQAWLAVYDENGGSAGRLAISYERAPVTADDLRTLLSAVAAQDGAPLRVTPDEIRRQRAAGWPDFHPEAYCHRCGQRNVKAWHADSATWAAAGLSEGDIVCPQCFTEAYASVEPHAVWAIRLDGARDGGRSEENAMSHAVLIRSLVQIAVGLLILCVVLVVAG